MPDTIKYVPQRTCISCRKVKNQNEMYRIALIGEELKLDQEERSVGRGCYLCKDQECIDKAFKKNAFQRTFKRAFSKDEVEKIGRYLNAK